MASLQGSALPPACASRAANHILPAEVRSTSSASLTSTCSSSSLYTPARHSATLPARYPPQVICAPRASTALACTSRSVGAGRAGPAPPSTAGRGGPGRAGGRAGGARGARAPGAAGAAARPGAAAARPAQRARPAAGLAHASRAFSRAQSAGVPRLRWLRRHTVKRSECVAPCALAPAWPACYARLAHRLFFSCEWVPARPIAAPGTLSERGITPRAIHLRPERVSFPVGPQAARLTALLELRTLRAAGAQRRLRAAVRAETARAAAAAPDALADWRAWRRAAPGAPDLAPPWPPPPPPRAGQLAPAELAALQTEMSRCGQGAGSALSRAGDERARGPGAPRLSVLACPRLTGGVRPPPAGRARWRRGRGRWRRRARRRSGAPRPRRRLPRKPRGGARPWRSWRGAAATPSLCAFACTPLMGAQCHCSFRFGGMAAPWGHITLVRAQMGMLYERCP